jgi:hypothetical protein
MGHKVWAVFFLPNLGIDTGIILQWLLSAHGFIQIMRYKILVDE